jgi:PAS domain-containing protein
MLLDNKPNPITQLNAMLQAFPDLLFTLDHNGVLLDCKGSDEVSTLFAPAGALIGQKLEDVLPRDLADKLRHGLRQLDNSDDPISLEYSARMAGAVRWFEARLVRTAPGETVVVVRDATRH